MYFQEISLGVEIDGGTFIQGGHVRGAAYERDREKDAEAMCLGYRVLRVTPRQVREGKALDWIERMFHKEAENV